MPGRAITQYVGLLGPANQMTATAYALGAKQCSHVGRAAYRDAELEAPAAREFVGVSAERGTNAGLLQTAETAPVASPTQPIDMAPTAQTRNEPASKPSDRQRVW